MSKAVAQNEKDSLIVKIDVLFAKKPLVLNQLYATKNDSLSIATVKFYLSNPELIYTDHTIVKTEVKPHLVDVSDDTSMQFKLLHTPTKTLAKIRFHLGVDSLASTSGALSGDLDPAKGMYWAWHSGYINCKIEGKSTQCPTRKNSFQFHIGGYQAPFLALRTVELPVSNTPLNNNQVQVIMDVAGLFDQLDLNVSHTVMSPSKNAMVLADLISQLFRLQ